MLHDVSVVIVNWNGAQYLPGCIGPLRGEVDIVVVDNGSADGSIGLLGRSFPDVRCVEAGRNLGFSAANNVGTRHCGGSYILFLNNDTCVQHGAVAAMRGAFELDGRIARYLRATQGEQV